MKKIAVIRALDFRIIQAEYTSFFRKINSIYISNFDSKVSNILKDIKCKSINIRLKSPYLFDPVEMIFGKKAHQSWFNFDQKSLEKALKNIDIYQIQEPFFLYSGQVSEIAKTYGKLLIMAPFMCFDHLSSFIPPYSISVKKSINQTDLFILRTSKVENYLSRFRIPESKKVLIHHGINTKRFFPDNNHDSEEVKILFVGQLDKSKGLDDILDVFPKLIKKTKKKIKLVICGNGRLINRVLEMSKYLPIEYKGYVSNLDLPQIYRNSDIFCGPSKDWYLFGIKRWEEQFGFVFTEAMASGLPIITNDSGATREIVGNDNFINSQGDIKVLENSLLTLINDNKMRQEIGIKNRIRCELMFDLKKQVSKEETEILKRFC